jgi:exodeoxyribonuclease VII large subunit
LRPPQPVSVGRLLALLKQSLGRAFGTVLVSGEVIDPLKSARGHLYFRLSDGQAELKTVMWHKEVQRLRCDLQPGDLVTVRGRLDVYPPRGDLQLVASALMQSGKGQKMLALDQLKKRLKAEGLFDRERRPLPSYPLRLGVVTSTGSAVIHDIYQSIQKRFPACQILLSPSAVTGEAAAEELREALERLKGRVEVVIVARGGGSFEELLPFSNENLVRQVASYPLPVIAAVGHGSDSVLLDLVADHTAPTPTAAAVLATPDREELRRQLTQLRNRSVRGVVRVVQKSRSDLEKAAALCRARHPAESLERAREKHKGLLQRLQRAMDYSMRSDRRGLERLGQALQPALISRRSELQRDQFEQLHGRLQSCGDRLSESKRAALNHLLERLQSVGPKTLLQRGFAMIYTAGELVTGSRGRTPGEELELHFADGRIVAEIKRVEPPQTSR